MDQIVFDIETKNSFADVGGEENLKKLEVSMVCLYSYKNNAYSCFNENELGKLEEIFRQSDLLIGFAVKRFDLPVLEKYFSSEGGFNLYNIPYFDILEKIEQSLGRRVKLDDLAKANLGVGKTGFGLEAIEFYKNGEMEKLKDYCLNDVKITKELYEMLKKEGHLWIPKKYSGKMVKWEYHI
jgi:DEAD/DEAH box helicase domain-containing protein